MTDVEIIEIVKDYGDTHGYPDCRADSYEISEALGRAVERARKDTPADLVSGTCPVCGHDGYGENGKKKYCDNCGQAFRR